MNHWVVRAHYPSGDAVEEYTTEAEARAAGERHLAQASWVAVRGPALEGPPMPESCSFCGKDRQAVRHLIAGPAGACVAICDECITLCYELISVVHV